MRDYLKFYIDGKWVDPVNPRALEVENPATEQVCGHISLGSKADVDRAVRAARRAFGTWSRTSRAERLDYLLAIQSEYEKRLDDLATAVTEEMGAPKALSQSNQVQLGLIHLGIAIETLQNFAFEERQSTTKIVREPIGVCGLITPWNWPLNQIAVKVFPALATGCTAILKPSEIAPFSGCIFAEIMHAAGVPAGVFNLVNGDGPGVGVALSVHPDVNMISFTGSTKAGVEISRNGAASVKRVCLELGGKSANILLDDDRLAAHVAGGVMAMMGNTGQTCAAPSRMLVPRSRMSEAVASACETAMNVTVGDPNGNFFMGPLSSKAQFEKVQGFIQSGIDEGAELVCGGTGRPNGLATGYYVKPTVFANVTSAMTIAREEIFGPVLSMIGYEDVDEAIAIANDSDYGLAAYVHGADFAVATKIAGELRAGQVQINDVFDMTAPFGGYKKSGKGREWGAWGFEEYLEVKAIIGLQEPA